MKRTTAILFLLFSIIACDVGEAFPTLTPIVEPSSMPEPTSTATETALPVFTPGIPTPTPICIQDVCILPTIDATPLGQESWEYWLMTYTQIRCVATRSDGSPWECRIRHDNSLDSSYDLVPYGTLMDSNSVYHCEVYAHCDPYITDWYHLEDGRWAASLPGVWDAVTLPTSEGK